MTQYFQALYKMNMNDNLGNYMNILQELKERQVYYAIFEKQQQSIKNKIINQKLCINLKSK